MKNRKQMTCLKSQSLIQSMSNTKAWTLWSLLQPAANNLKCISNNNDQPKHWKTQGQKPRESSLHFTALAGEKYSTPILIP